MFHSTDALAQHPIVHFVNHNPHGFHDQLTDQSKTYHYCSIGSKGMIAHPAHSHQHPRYSGLGVQVLMEGLEYIRELEEGENNDKRTCNRIPIMLWWKALQDALIWPLQ